MVTAAVTSGRRRVDSGEESLVRPRQVSPTVSRSRLLRGSAEKREVWVLSLPGMLQGARGLGMGQRMAVGTDRKVGDGRGEERNTQLALK